MPRWQSPSPAVAKDGPPPHCARLRRVNRLVVLLLACVSCGGRVEGTSDPGSPYDAGMPPTEIPVGDAGLTCSTPVVSPGSGPNECTFTMSCAGGLTVDGEYLGGAAVVRCAVNGSQTDDFTILGTDPEEYQCADPAGFAAVAAKCH